jgi:hypothetical protein
MRQEETYEDLQITKKLGRTQYTYEKGETEIKISKTKKKKKTYMNEYLTKKNELVAIDEHQMVDMKTSGQGRRKILGSTLSLNPWTTRSLVQK